jgi:hypothetical protein
VTTLPARLLAATGALVAIVVTAVTALLLAPRAPAGHRTPAQPAARAAGYPITAYPRATRTAAARRPHTSAIAYLRAAHFSPDTKDVDVYLTGFAGGRTQLWLSDVGYGDVSGYRRIVAGTYVVSMRPHGAARSSAPVASWTVALAAGRSYTAAAVGTGANLHGVVLADTAPPSTGDRAAVRVIQAADRAAAPTVRIAAGPTIARGLHFGDASAYRLVRAGRHTVVVDGGSATAGATVDLAPRSSTSLVVLDDAAAGFTVRAVIDIAAPMHVPSGPVDAGGGGTSGARAARPTGSPQNAVTPGPRDARGPAGAGMPGPSTTRPVELRIRAIGVRTRLDPLARLADGALQPPPRWLVAGWYAGGVVPGRPGPAVVVGHVDSVTGPAVFFRLDRLRAGERVVITTAAGRRLTYVIDALHRYRKTRFPTAVVYGPTPDPELRLITCTGRFDAATGSYLDNLVVSAHLAG